ncbi:BUB protein kinase Bub1 [Schizosaccharomyces japonicus yFS275]|uniref:BUB protein kinase Bub1 n=1 Tax=Schizosaccharomyces japonicus (strain yFS275 / FY16936) TaxID=402676 RepID=B6JXF5_SCHJY|nr:BUB protein kinase Bub1 [Schizosaccharomyces japonicus yFS275]EEB06056.1 BUB protein kinase Bub1 [Schizosaccharomyces japonicus yFS275]
MADAISEAEAGAGASRKLQEIQNLAIYQEELEVIEELDDPLDVWSRFIKWLQNTTTIQTDTIQSYVDKGIQAFEKCRHYANDARYLQIWLAKIEWMVSNENNLESAVNTFYELAGKNIGLELALFYEQYATLLAHCGRWKEAEEVYQVGISREARPFSRLWRRANEFFRQMKSLPPGEETTVSEYQPPFPPARKVFGNKGFSGAEKPVRPERAFAVFSDNEKTSAGPHVNGNKSSSQGLPIERILHEGISGKRTEYSSFDFRLLYQNEEVSMEELRGRSYDHCHNEPVSSGKITVTESRPLDAMVDKPADVYDALTPVVLSPRPEQTKVASPTINTKAALADILDLFNQPLKADLATSSIGADKKNEEPLAPETLRSENGFSEDYNGPSSEKEIKIPPVYGDENDYNTRKRSLSPVYEQDLNDNHKREKHDHLEEPDAQLSYPQTEKVNLANGSPLVAEQAQLSLKQEPKLQEVVPQLQVDDLATNSPETSIHLDAAVVNPLDQDLRDTLFEALRPALTKLPIYHEHASTFGQLQEIEMFTRSGKRRASTSSRSRRTSGSDFGGRVFTVQYSPEEQYNVLAKLGQGAFAPVYLVEEQESSLSGTEPRRKYALKIETPSSFFEFYLTNEANARLKGDRAYNSVIHVHQMHMYDDASHLLMAYSSQGSILDLVNKTRERSQGAGMDEILAMFFTVEFLRTIETLHSKHIIHGDLKADNALLRLEPVEETAWSSQYFRDGSNGWASKGIVLIDFGRGIDMSLFNPSIQFYADWETDAQDCAEMREGKPWTYQVDYHGLASIIFTMLFGKYIETRVDIIDGVKRHVLAQRMKRYWKQDMWNRLFDVLLNSTFHAGDTGFPITHVIANIRLEFEDYLEEHASSGVGLKVLLKQISRLV